VTAGGRAALPNARSGGDGIGCDELTGERTAHLIRGHGRHSASEPAACLAPTVRRLRLLPDYSRRNNRCDVTCHEGLDDQGSEPSLLEIQRGSDPDRRRTRLCRRVEYRYPRGLLGACRLPPVRRLARPARRGSLPGPSDRHCEHRALRVRRRWRASTGTDQPHAQPRGVPRPSHPRAKGLVPATLLPLPQTGAHGRGGGWTSRSA